MVNKISIAPSPNSIHAINLAIKNSDTSKTLFVELKVGHHGGAEGILIKRSNVCLYGTGRPSVERTKFSNETAEPSVVKIYDGSNVTVKGLEIVGTISPDNRDVGPTGISVVNFSGKEISNIYIEDNVIHTVGQYYDYGSADGFWRYKDSGKENCGKHKALNGDLKVSCGEAHGIHVASNQNLVSNVQILKNVLYDLQLGKSEAITVGERVYDFKISDNHISDIDNIAIDIAGRQDSEYQSTWGRVSENNISGLRSAAEFGGQNDSYPFVAGIYVDGGTGLSWEKNLEISGNTIEDFGIGISVGSENNFCDKNPDRCNDDYCLRNPTKCKKKKCLFKKKCNYVQVQFVEIANNDVIRGSQVYGIGIGKDDSNQNSQTWNIKIIGNTLSGNAITTKSKHLGYSHLHFGSLEPDSLFAIEVRENIILSEGDNTLLVAVKPSNGAGNMRPSVSFYGNKFYSAKTATPIWRWGDAGNALQPYFVTDLVQDGTENLRLPLGVVGGNNLWKRP
jgi:hypothetical protein